MINVSSDVLNKIKKIIEDNKEVTITLNKNDLISIYSAIHDEIVFTDSMLVGMQETDISVEDFCERIAEYQADSISNMQDTIHFLADKIINSADMV